jgi:hypothetical protein
VKISEIITESKIQSTPSQNSQEKYPSDFFVRSLESEKQVIEYVKSSLIPEMRSCNVPISPENHFTRLSSAIFEGASRVINSGKKFLDEFRRLDQRKNMKIAVGESVSILNIIMSGDHAELFGFRTPKKITKILREPSDKKIIQIEFNNDPEDVWPRSTVASYQGRVITTSAFFSSANELDQALLMLTLSKPENITLRMNILEGKSQNGLSKWFRERWVNIGKKKKGRYEPCGSSGETQAYAKCVPAKTAYGMSKKEKASAVRRKRQAQKQAGRAGKSHGGTGKSPIRVKTKTED